MGLGDDWSTVALPRRRTFSPLGARIPAVIVSHHCPLCDQSHTLCSLGCDRLNPLLDYVYICPVNEATGSLPAGIANITDLACPKTYVEIHARG